MTDHRAFLRSAPVLRLLERAGCSAGTPLSVHYVKRNQEGPRVCGWGACAGCRVVSEAADGQRACRVSRTTASVMALQQGRPIAFVCHMGFACVAVPAFSDEHYVVTLGPYCPMEAQQSLEEDVLAGLEALLGEPLDTLPFALDDIHRAPASAVPAVADWLRESLGAMWAAFQADEEPDADAARDDPRLAAKASSRETPGDSLAVLAREMAAALTAGSHARARALLQGHLEELGRGKARNAGVRRARVAAVVASTLEALGRAGVSLEAGSPGHEGFVQRLPSLSSDSELLDDALRVFSFLRRKSVQNEKDSSLPHYPELYALVKARLLDGVTLEYVAGELGESPSAISHRLKRKFGMSFSDYVAHIRIDMAKELIRRTTLSATEIARRTGIADQSNFSKMFKKVAGMSPSAYRKAHGKGS